MKVTEIQVLERAIKDAMKGGLSKLDLLALLPPGHTDQHIMVMLYDHRFLQALFGNKMIPHQKYATEFDDRGQKAEYFTTREAWQHHGIEMFLSGDPLAYIAKVKYGIKVEE